LIKIRINDEKVAASAGGVDGGSLRSLSKGAMDICTLARRNDCIVDPVRG